MNRTIIIAAAILIAAVLVSAAILLRPDPARDAFELDRNRQRAIQTIDAQLNR